MLTTTLINKKVTMPTNALKSQKTIGGLDNFHINDWQENRIRIRINNLHLVFCDFQKTDRWPPGLR